MQQPGDAVVPLGYPCKPQYNHATNGVRNRNMLEAYKKEQELAALEARIKDDAEDVKKTLEEMLAAGSPSVRALFALARCQVSCEEEDAAKQTLEAVLGQVPDHAGARLELARLLHAGGDTSTAIDLLQEATRQAPQLTAGWKLLAECLRRDGQSEAGREAARQYDLIKAFNGNLQHAETAFAGGDFQTADQICRKLLQQVPGEIRTLRILARIARRLRYFEAGISILERCLQSRPDDAALRLDYAQALLAGKKYREALVQCDHVTDLAPEFIDIYEVQAEALYNLGQYQEAMAIFRALSKTDAKRVPNLVHLGKVLTTVGETAQAIECFQQALAERPALGQAYWELASLKTYRFSSEEIAAMQGLLNTGEIADMDRVLLQFALGRALEDEGRFAESFEYLQAANSAYAKHQSLNYVSQNAALKSVFTAEYFVRRKDDGDESKAPIFIVGMPRSGSTLVEQILSAHSEVDATAELTEIVSIARELNGQGQPGQGQYPGSVVNLTSRQVQEYAQRYLDFVQPLRRGSDFFIDKTPGNFHHIGLIKTLFPKARIIDVRRDPMASGWSLFKHFFADSFLYSYDLETIGRYYNDYLELMGHWNAVLPGQILTLRYEDLVNDLPGAVDALLRYCSLPFEKGCIDFHLNKRAVATPSSEQVRSPLYATAVEHWKNYEEFLTPLRKVISAGDEH